MYNDNGNILVSSAPIYLNEPIDLSKLVAWEVQGEVDGDHVQDIYVPLEAATKEN